MKYLPTFNINWIFKLGSKKPENPDHTSTGVLVNSLEASLMNYLPILHINWIFKLGSKNRKSRTTQAQAF